jgi:hypothetical protein
MVNWAKLEPIQKTRNKNSFKEKNKIKTDLGMITGPVFQAWTKIKSKSVIWKKGLGLQRIVFRVARWFVFKPKIQICINFGVSCNGR